METSMNEQRNLNGLAAAMIRSAVGALALVGLAIGQADHASAQPTNVFMSSYNAIQIGGVGVPGTRENAFVAVTDGISGGGNGLDTFNLDITGVTTDFVGLEYASPQRFDTINIVLGGQFGDGGDWEATPKVYILKNKTLTGDRVEPHTSSNWIEVSAVETSGHIFSQFGPGPGGTLSFDLSGVPAADRSGWGWAVGGVDGYSANPGPEMNFISVSDVSATGAPAPAPAFIPSPTPEPVNLVSNRYNSLAQNGQFLIDDNRGSAFAALTNGVLDRDTALGLDGYDTHGHFPNTLTDFVGLQYGATYRFDSLTVELGQQFGDGGDWETTPRIFILKNPIDTDKLRPELDPVNWLEVSGAIETTNHVFTPIALNGPGGTINFDLSAIPASLRTGYGWAIGGVDGNEAGGGGSHFISLTEVSATGVLAVVPEPTSAMMLVIGTGTAGLFRRRRLIVA
jgi:hypothetical protein